MKEKKKKEKDIIKNSESTKKKIGFTLIELLAVIIILGILITVAVVGVSRYINDSRKATYVANAKKYIEGASFKVNSGEINTNDTDTTYYMPYKMVNVEKGGGSPFGKLTTGYVVVTYDSHKYDYYWASSDDQKIGFFLTFEKNLESNLVAYNVEVNTDTGIGNRSKIVVFNDDGSIKEEKMASKNILDQENQANTVISGIFNFDKTTGTILNIIPYTINNLSKCTEMITNKTDLDNNTAINICKNDQEYAIYILEQHYNDNEIISVFTINNLNHIIIPETIEGITVRSIKEIRSYGWSDIPDNHKIYSIEIPNTIISIQYGALDGNFYLYNIVNKTGKKFEWNQILHSYHYPSQVNEPQYNFETGFYIDDIILNITNTPVTYDLKNIFTLSNGYKLINNNGYITEISDYPNWTIMEYGQTYPYCGAIRIRNGDNILYSNAIHCVY